LHLHPRLPCRLPGRNLMYNVSLPWPERYLEGISIQTFERESSLLSDDFRAQSGPHALELFRSYLENAPARDPLGRVLYLDTKTYLPGDILTKVDRMSMLTSLEARVPLLDHQLVEWITGLPSEYKMKRGSQKYLLKKLALRVGVPPEVLDRPKQGFALPLVHWIKNELKDMVLTVLLEPRTLERGYFNPRAVRQLLEEHFRGRRVHSGRIWRLLMLELWHRNFLENAGEPSLAASHASSLSGSEA
jgi:asparagine synthase (glutamine-hydrolysing)